MRLNASSFYGLYRPSPCPLRVFLRAKGVKEGEPSPYEEVIIDLGRRYETAHVATLKNVVDLAKGDEDERVTQTIKAVQQGAEVLYLELTRFRGHLNLWDGRRPDGKSIKAAISG